MNSTPLISPARDATSDGLHTAQPTSGSWRSARLTVREITELTRILNARFPAGSGGPVAELRTALESALWTKTVPVELSPDGQLAYRLAWSKNRDWKIGPAQVPAYRRILDQLPTTIAMRPGMSTPAVLVRESVGALQAHHTQHAAGTHHYDQVIADAITAAALPAVTMRVTITTPTTELLRLLHTTSPTAILSNVLSRLR